MSDRPHQNYRNHRSIDYIMNALALLYPAAAVLGFLGLASHSARWSAAAAIVLAVATLILAYKARVYSLKVQDRIIRLEMRLRLAALLKGDLEGKGETLALSQLIGLRFASDAEMPDLVRRVTAENITRADDIKKLVKDWQADNVRI
ncbi:MAG: hypothetical protein HZB26_06695 [Candidatus Hydrogenedentes bacterium]|nr:hypothetical protein [Candidatus Hydrogenedentota bacterium]